MSLNGRRSLTNEILPGRRPGYRCEAFARNQVAAKSSAGNVNGLTANECSVPGSIDAIDRERPEINAQEFPADEHARLARFWILSETGNLVRGRLNRTKGVRQVFH